MKIKFDVSPAEYQRIRDILQAHLPADCQVWVFGSRAKHQTLHGSDLDLALEGQLKIEPTVIWKLETAFEESPLPYRVDIIDLKAISEEFFKQIKMQLVPFYEGKNQPEARIPKLRFPEFEGEWFKSILSENCEINPSNKTLPSEFHYIDLESVNNGILGTTQLISKFEAPSRAQRALKKKDILFQTVRPYQKNNYFFKLEGEYVASTGYAQIRTDQISSFLYHFLHTTKFVNKVMVRSTGTSYPAINSNDLKKISVTFPSIKEEQQKIALFLRKVDQKIDLLQRKKDQLTAYKKGMMQKLFPATGRQVPELRFKDESGKDFPEWEEKKLGELGKFYRGHSYNSSNVCKNGLLVLRSSNIKFGHLNLEEDLQFVDKKCDDKIYLRKEDLVICMANGSRKLVGKSAQYLGENTNSITVGAFCSICRPQSDIVKWVLQSVFYRRYLHVLLAGTNINNLKNSDLEKLKFMIPKSSSEQQKIANYLTALDRKIELVDKKFTQAQAFKKGLLQQMFV